MSGADVHRQVMEALTYHRAVYDEFPATCERMNEAYAALAPCVALTAEEAGRDADRETCERCECGYAVWSAPSDLWNLTMRGGDRAAADEFSFLCPRCFMLLAEERVPGAGPLWIVRPEREDDFDEFLPSGRFARPLAPKEAPDG